MKIACISASKVPSLTANSLQMMKTCQAISQLGHDVHLILPHEQGSNKVTDLAAFYGLKLDLPIQRLPSRRGWHRHDFAFQAVRKALQLKVDLAYVWLLQAGIYALLARLPVAIELHGPPEGKFGPWLFRLFLRLGGEKRLLPITQALATQITEHYRLSRNDREQMRISPNGVELDRYEALPAPAAARQLLHLPPMLTAGYTGHLYPGRGMNLLLELARCFPGINFLWVGGQPGDVQAWSERLTAGNIANVTLTGFIENSQLPMYQAAADILLMPYERVITGSSGGDSSAYASPMKMFEYMACKRAIISSDLPVIREVLNSSNATLCPPEDMEAWSQALGDLLKNDEKRLALARQAGQDIQKYTWLERASHALEGFPA